MPVYVYVIDIKNVRPRLVAEMTKKFKATVNNNNLLVKLEDFDSQTEYVVKRQRHLKVGLADISKGRLDIIYSPSEVFSIKFDEMIRRVSDSE